MANGPDIYDSYANASNNITLGAFLAAFKSRLDKILFLIGRVMFSTLPTSTGTGDLSFNLLNRC